MKLKHVKGDQEMKQFYFKGLCLVVMLMGFGGFASAAEIITAEDIREKVVTKDVLVRTADNVVVLVDTSASMSAVRKKFRPKTKYLLQKEALATGITRLPDLGYNIGIYSFTPWNAIYPMQRFDRERAAAALDQLPAVPSGTTPLVQSLNQLEDVLKDLRGKTIVYIFSDGGFDRRVSGRGPGDVTAALASQYDVCFQVIDHASDPDGRKRVRDMGKANPCSRVIPFDSYVTDPFYAMAPLFMVKSGTSVVTIREQIVKGLRVNNLLFDFDKADLRPQSQEELDAVGRFLQQQPNASAYFVGYSCNIGPAEHNLRLSQRRAEAAAAYLAENFNIDDTRLVTTWYGMENPVASNDTREGRALNRRVEITVASR
jgi:OOP family OmpA-OmpF porin